MYDIHSHILFGIDDGAKTVDDTVELCQIAEAEGVRAIVATPHIREGVWANDHARISARLDDVREELKKREVAVDVILGCEIYFNSDMIDGIRSGAFPTYADRNRYLLFELPHFFIMRQVQDVVFEFRTAGLTPVLAHPERNAQVMTHLDELRELVRMGTVLQVTAMSVTGKFGRRARKAAEILLDEGLAHVVASDAHHARYRPTRLKEAYMRVASRWGEPRAQALFVDNPKRVIEGLEVDTSVPLEPPARGLTGLIRRVLR